MKNKRHIKSDHRMALFCTKEIGTKFWPEKESYTVNSRVTSTLKRVFGVRRALLNFEIFNVTF